MPALIQRSIDDYETPVYFGLLSQNLVQCEAKYYCAFCWNNIFKLSTILVYYNTSEPRFDIRFIAQLK